MTRKERLLVELNFFCRGYNFSQAVKELAKYCLKEGKALHYWLPSYYTTTPRIEIFEDGNNSRVSDITLMRHTAVLHAAVLYNFHFSFIVPKDLQISLKMIEEFNNTFKHRRLSLKEEALAQTVLRKYLQLLKKGTAPDSIRTLMVALRLSE